jgi:hypothetical protein
MKIKIIVTILLVAFILASCVPAAKVIPTETAVSTSTLTLTPVPTATATITPMPILTPLSEEWKTYSDSEYDFLISYPAYFEITPGENNTSLYIGEQISIWISDVNPLECRGDCPLVESTAPVTVANIDAIKVEGYIGAIGGNIPQRYMSYILQRDNRYYNLTLYAISRFDFNNYDPYTIWPLKENDIALFDQILETFKFTN